MAFSLTEVCYFGKSRNYKINRLFSSIDDNETMLGRDG
jgi:hypothetical protein